MLTIWVVAVLVEKEKEEVNGGGRWGGGGVEGSRWEKMWGRRRKILHFFFLLKEIASRAWNLRLIQHQKVSSRGEDCPSSYKEIIHPVHWCETHHIHIVACQQYVSNKYTLNRFKCLIRTKLSSNVCMYDEKKKR